MIYMPNRWIMRLDVDISNKFHYICHLNESKTRDCFFYMQIDILIPLLYNLYECGSVEPRECHPEQNNSKEEKMHDLVWNEQCV